MKFLAWVTQLRLRTSGVCLVDSLVGVRLTMSDIIREICYREGHECGECGEWVTKENPLPCKGLCTSLMEAAMLAEELFSLDELEAFANEQNRETGSD